MRNGIWGMRCDMRYEIRNMKNKIQNAKVWLKLKKYIKEKFFQEGRSVLDMGMNSMLFFLKRIIWNNYNKLL